MSKNNQNQWSYNLLLERIFTPYEESPLNFSNLCKQAMNDETCDIEDFGYALSHAILTHAAKGEGEFHTVWVLLRDLITDEMEKHGYVIPEPAED